MMIDTEAAEKWFHHSLADRSDDVVDIALATRKAVRTAVRKQDHESSELVYNNYCVSDAFTFTEKFG